MTNDNPKSNCCGAEMKVSSADEGTACYICLKCFEVCDPKPIPSEPSRHSIGCAHIANANECVICKPVEPSVEGILRERIKELEGRLVDQAVTICEMSKVFAKKITELERKE